jgi:NMD protein affecting ribosome stability and mRNA decay
VQANVCTECGISLDGKQAWVRSGRLLCGDCDFAHKAPSRQRLASRVKRPHTPRRGTYWKPQVFHTASMSWQDVQKACDTVTDAWEVARAAVPKAGGRIRAMRVDPDGTRTPTAAIVVPSR